MKMKRYDPYEILQLPHGASKREIKKAYRFLAKRFHPDCNPENPEAEENFKHVQWAYSILFLFSAMRNLHKGKGVRDVSINRGKSESIYKDP
jgi:curved DNA-binding protein CbpA